MNPATTITGAHGSYVDFFDLDNSVIKLEDITERLSRIVRFNGGTIRPFTVGEHTLVLNRIATIDKKSDTTRLYILLHDATEAFMGDLVSPLKAVLPEFTKLEEKLFDSICKQIAPNVTLSQEDKDYCKKIDTEIRYAEWVVLNNKQLIDPTGAWTAIYGSNVQISPVYKRLITEYSEKPNVIVKMILQRSIEEIVNGE